MTQGVLISCSVTHHLIEHISSLLCVAEGDFDIQLTHSKFRCDLLLEPAVDLCTTTFLKSVESFPLHL